MFTSSSSTLTSRAASRSLKSRALQWLAQREQSRSELRRKLLRAALADERAAVSKAASSLGAGGSGHRDAKARAMCSVGVDSGDIADDVSPADGEAGLSAAQRVDDLLDWLEAHDFLSQERFIESRVHARSARFGNLRIRLELKQHQLALPPELARALIDSERQRAADVRARKFEHLPANASERAKQGRYLAARGFSAETIAQALRDRPEDERFREG